MNTQQLINMLDDYLQFLQQDNASDEKITEVKLMIWAIEDDIKLRQWLNNLTVTNKYYKR